MYDDRVNQGNFNNWRKMIWRGCLSLLHFFAITSTVYRLYRQKKIQKIWWDDYFAFLCLVADLAYFPTLWARYSPGLSDSASTIPKGEVAGYLAAAWCIHIFHIIVLWGTRISLAFTIRRFIPAQTKMAKAVAVLPYLCGLCGVGYLIHISVYCGAINKTWDKVYPYKCPLTTNAAITRTSVCIIADILLVIIPFFGFYRVIKLTVITRRLIKACFAASSLTLLSNILTAGILTTTQLSNPRPTSRAGIAFKATMLSHLVTTVALIVCNLLVVLTSLYRHFRTDPPIRTIGEPNVGQAAHPAHPGHLPEVISPPETTPESPQIMTSSFSHPTSQLGSNGSQLVLTEIYEDEFTTFNSQTQPQQETDLEHQLYVTFETVSHQEPN